MKSQSSGSSTFKKKCKMVFLGDQSVGKTSIIERYVNNSFQDRANPTIGIDFITKVLSIGTRQYRIQLWDTAGQQRFRSVIPSYLKNAHCAIIVFDLSQRSSFQSLRFWESLFNQNKNINSSVIVIGNKNDLPRKVTQDEAEKVCNELGIKYFQMSAKTSSNVQSVFLQIIEHIGGMSNNSYVSYTQPIKEQKEEEQHKGALQAIQVQSKSIVIGSNQKKEDEPKRCSC